MLLEDERGQVVAAGRRVAAAGLVVGTAGNLSLRRGERVLVTPTGGVLGELRPEMVSVVDLDGRLVDGELAPTTELPLHLAVYRATGVGAVAHAHALASTAVAVTGDELPPVHYATLLLGGPVRVAPYATFGSEELAVHVVQALEGRHAALMQNHGSVALGHDLDEACSRLELVEWLAELYARSVALGRPRVLSEDELRAAAGAFHATRYGTTRAAAPEPPEPPESPPGDVGSAGRARDGGGAR